MNRRTLRIAGVSALAALAFGVAAPAASAAEFNRAQTSATATIDARPLARATVGDAEGIRALEALAQAIQNLPERLQSKTLNDPEVVQQLTKDMERRGVNPASVSGLVAPNWFSCTAAIAVFAAENAIPVAKVSRIIGKVGGFTKFAKYAWRYLKDGYAPAEAGEEFAEFVMSVSGLGGVANACG
ncbi:hypothetical protein FGW37_22380 [Streptomyces rectiverticillatus]|uniref:hypothetical protein n=1 Tax=Streptomyces rectiverticillatus TaxID=173860 RepID=UPI0015C3CD09|nr:hypothetical protein [Streptomyces rectiverticillatus]QLE73959.1 hypothetical protein FGW37_22380 [Streptomyces rectiverticillatus]